MRQLATRTALLTAALAMVGTAGCDESVVAPSAGTYYGSTFVVGDGTARSFVTIDAMGNPACIGLVMSEQALNSLPVGTDREGGNGGFELDVPMPPQARPTAFDHIALAWSPQGHAAAPYALPHFDVHFFMITRSQRTKMTGVGDDSLRMVAPPNGRFLPSGFVPTNVGVPEAGMTWVDPTSPELNGGLFSKTFTWGSYDGNVVFVEPRITRDCLEGRPSLAENLKLPESYKRTGLYYPTTYNVGYDAATKEYIVSLGGMTKR